jgi:hypothetical protein
MIIAVLSVMVEHCGHVDQQSQQSAMAVARGLDDSGL